MKYFLVVEGKQHFSLQKSSLESEWGFWHLIVNKLPSLKLTVKAPENRPSQKEFHLPIIHFQGRFVSFREGRTKKHRNHFWIIDLPMAISENMWGVISGKQHLSSPPKRIEQVRFDALFIYLFFIFKLTSGTPI